MLNSMRRILNMSFEETANMPLARLAQHLREVIHFRSAGKAMQLTDEEAAIWGEYLKQQTELAKTPEAQAAQQREIAEIAKRRMSETRTQLTMNLIPPEVVQRNHDLALMDSFPLCGLHCRPTSIRTFVLMKQCANKFIVGGVPGPADVAVFLWFHSPAYCLDERARKKFMKSIRHLLSPTEYPRVVVAINAYLVAAFMDSPVGRDASGTIWAGTVPAVIDLLAKEYGWSDAAIKEMPIARVFLFRLTILNRLAVEAAAKP